MASDRTADRDDHLLDDLCIGLGFCLSPEAHVRLSAAPPADVDAVTDAVFAAEGLDPNADRRLREAVRARVAEYLQRGSRKA